MFCLQAHAGGRLNETQHLDFWLQDKLLPPKALRKMSGNPVVVGWSLCRERLTRRAGGISVVGSPFTLAPDSPGFFSSRWSKARSGDSSGQKQLCGRFAHEGLWLNHFTASPFRWHKQTRFSHAAVPSTAAPVLPRRSFPPSRGSGLWANPAESPGLSCTPKCLVQGPGELLNQRWLRGQKLPQTVSCSVQRKTAWFVP